MPPFRSTSARIDIVDRIVITVRIKIQPVGIFRIEIRRIIGADESAPSGRVVTRIEVVKSRLLVVIVAAVSDRVLGCDAVGVERNRAITPSVICIAAHLGSRRIVNRDHVAKQVALEIIAARRAGFGGMQHTNDATLIVEIHDLFGSAAFSVVLAGFTLVNQSAGLVIVEHLTISRQRTHGDYRTVQDARSVRVCAADALPERVIVVGVSMHSRACVALGQP